MLEIAAWIATACILTTYAVMVKRPTWALRFHVANALGCVPLAWLNIEARTWPAVVVNLGFGVPAWVAVVREISRRRRFRAIIRAEVDRIMPDVEAKIASEFHRQIFGEPDASQKEMLGLGAVLTPDGLIPRSMFPHADDVEDRRTQGGALKPCVYPVCVERRTLDDGCPPGTCVRG